MQIPTARPPQPTARPVSVLTVRATSGREALKGMLTEEFALVLMDIDLPELDGYDTASLIRNNDRLRLTPIIS